MHQQKDGWNKDLDVANAFYRLGMCQRFVATSAAEGPAKNQLYEDARINYEAALEIRKSILGETHLRVAALYHELGMLCAKKQEFEDAKDLHQKSLDTRLDLLGERHKDTATTYNDLAFACHKIALTKQTAESAELWQLAETCYKKSFDVRRIVFDPKHSRVGDTLRFMAEMYKERGEQDTEQFARERSNSGLMEKAQKEADSSSIKAAVLYREAHQVYSNHDPEGKPAKQMKSAYEDVVRNKLPLITRVSFAAQV